MGVVHLIHTFEQIHLQDQLADFSQNLSSFGWGKDCIRFWGRSDQNKIIRGKTMTLFSSPEPKAHGELLWSLTVRRRRRPDVRLSTIFKQHLLLNH